MCEGRGGEGQRETSWQRAPEGRESEKETKEA